MGRGTEPCLDPFPNGRGETSPYRLQCLEPRAFSARLPLNKILNAPLKPTCRIITKLLSHTSKNFVWIEAVGRPYFWLRENWSARDQEHVRKGASTPSDALRCRTHRATVCRICCNVPHRLSAYVSILHNSSITVLHYKTQDNARGATRCRKASHHNARTATYPMSKNLKSNSVLNSQ